MAATLSRDTRLAAQQLLASWTGTTNEFEAPNMDGIWEDDLLAYEHLFGQLAEYARLKREAMAKRVRGLIGGEDGAASLEMRCERIYRELPAWNKW